MSPDTLIRACGVADQLLLPAQEVYAGVSGHPDDYTNVLPGAAQHEENRAASCFQQLLCDVTELTSVTLPAYSLSKPLACTPGALVEEVSEQQADLYERQRQQAQFVAKSCQVAALYASHPPLLTPWSSHQLDAASRALLKQLHAAMPHSVLASQQSAAAQHTEQDLFVTVLPVILPLLSALMPEAAHTFRQGMPQQGPDTFTRCLAGRQLAFLIRQLDYKHLASILPLTLPYVLATVKDLSTQVQCYGLHALHHIATEALPSDLKPHQQALMALAKDMLVGCDDVVWPVAAPTSCLIISTLGTSQPGYQEVVRELLRQAETQCHKQARRLAWLQSVKPIFQVLGLQTLHFFSSLMPLLLGWCHAPDQATCLAALQALQEVIKHTWPRMPAHASFLWSQLQEISTEQAMCAHAEHDENASLSTTMAETMQHIANIGEMLYLCGGSALQKTIRDASDQSMDPAVAVMLQSNTLHKSAQKTEGLQLV